MTEHLIGDRMECLRYRLFSCYFSDISIIITLCFISKWTSQCMLVVQNGALHTGTESGSRDLDLRSGSMWSHVRFDTACSKRSCRIQIKASACPWPEAKQVAEICIGSGSRAPYGVPQCLKKWNVPSLIFFFFLAWELQKIQWKVSFSNMFNYFRWKFHHLHDAGVNIFSFINKTLIINLVDIKCKYRVTTVW